jgi:hypothetical protein
VKTGREQAIFEMPRPVKMLHPDFELSYSIRSQYRQGTELRPLYTHLFLTSVQF